MHLNDMALSLKSRFFNEVRKVFDEARRGPFFDGSACDADGKDC